MSTQKAQRNAGKRQPLSEIMEDNNCQSKSKQPYLKQQLTDKVRQLQSRIEEQNIQIQVLSEQLSNEIRLKEQIRHQLNEEKQKTRRSPSPHAILRQANCLTKRKSGQCDLTQDDKIKQYEWRLVQMREHIKYKDEIIDKNKQKFDECSRKQKGYLQIEKEIRCLRELFIKSQQKQVNSQQQIQSLKTKMQRLLQNIRQKQEELAFSEKHFHKLQTDHKALMNQFYRQQEEIRIIQSDMKELMNRQNQQIRSLQNQLAMSSEGTETNFKSKENLANIKRQIRRVLFTHLKDVTLRKKLQIEMSTILEGRSLSPSCTPRKMSTIVQQ